MRYVLVVRILGRVEPKVHERGQGPRGRTVHEGSRDGEVLVFDPVAKKHVGGYRWAVESSASVSDGKIQTRFLGSRVGRRAS